MSALEQHGCHGWYIQDHSVHEPGPWSPVRLRINDGAFRIAVKGQNERPSIALALNDLGCYALRLTNELLDLLDGE